MKNVLLLLLLCPYNESQWVQNVVDFHCMDKNHTGLERHEGL